MEVGAVVRLIPPYMQGARGEETSRAAVVEVGLGGSSRQFHQGANPGKSPMELRIVILMVLKLHLLIFM